MDSCPRCGLLPSVSALRAGVFLSGSLEAEQAAALCREVHLIVPQSGPLEALPEEVAWAGLPSRLARPGACVELAPRGSSPQVLWSHPCLPPDRTVAGAATETPSVPG